MAKKLLDNVYIIAHNGNPYETCIGIPLKYPKSKHSEIIRKTIKILNQNLKDKNHIAIPIRSKKIGKGLVEVADIYTNFLNNNCSLENKKVKNEGDLYKDSYACFIVLIDIISKYEYKKRIDIKLKDLVKEKTKKPVFKSKRLEIERIRKEILRRYIMKI